MNGFLSFFLSFVLFLLPTGTWRIEEEQEKVFVARKKIFLEEEGKSYGSEKVWKLETLFPPNKNSEKRTVCRI